MFYRNNITFLQGVNNYIGEINVSDGEYDASVR